MAGGRVRDGEGREGESGGGSTTTDLISDQRGLGNQLSRFTLLNYVQGFDSVGKLVGSRTPKVKVAWGGWTNLVSSGVFVSFLCHLNRLVIRCTCRCTKVRIEAVNLNTLRSSRYDRDHSRSKGEVELLQVPPGEIVENLRERRLRFPETEVARK